MEVSQFRTLATERFNYCLDLMCGKKNDEYSRNNDKLHNFKTAARYDNESPEKSLWGMLKKHLVSIQDIVNDIEQAYRPGGGCVKLPSREVLAEKSTDTIDYIVLFEALIIERISLMEQIFKESDSPPDPLRISLLEQIFKEGGSPPDSLL